MLNQNTNSLMLIMLDEQCPRYRADVVTCAADETVKRRLDYNDKYEYV